VDRTRSEKPDTFCAAAVPAEARVHGLEQVNDNGMLGLPQSTEQWAEFYAQYMLDGLRSAETYRTLEIIADIVLNRPQFPNDRGIDWTSVEQVCQAWKDWAIIDDDTDADNFFRRKEVEALEDISEQGAVPPHYLQFWKRAADAEPQRTRDVEVMKEIIDADDDEQIREILYENYDVSENFERPTYLRPANQST